MNRRTLILTALFLIPALSALSLVTKPITRHVHTSEVMNQLERAYLQYLADDGAPAASEEAFVALTERWNVDWNSCRRQDGALLDGWGNKMQITISAHELDLRSAGPDRAFQTEDDLIKTIAVVAHEDEPAAPAQEQTAASQ